jgi:hypothetical protein
VCRGLPPPSECARPGAPRKKGEVVTKLPHPNDAQKKILHALNVGLPRLLAGTSSPTSAVWAAL